MNVLDDNLANLTAAFKAKGMWDNTIMVLTSDNGGAVHPLKGLHGASQQCIHHKDGVWQWKGWGGSGAVWLK